MKSCIAVVSKLLAGKLRSGQGWEYAHKDRDSAVEDVVDYFASDEISARWAESPNFQEMRRALGKYGRWRWHDYEVEIKEHEETE
jgi:hypothetical protein